MLKVIKKDRRIENFIPEKIKTCISNSANDINFHFNQKELDLIAKDIENELIAIRGEDGMASTYEIRSLVVKSLKDMGYSKVAYSFYKGK